MHLVTNLMSSKGRYRIQPGRQFLHSSTCQAHLQVARHSQDGTGTCKQVEIGVVQRAQALPQNQGTLLKR